MPKHKPSVFISNSYQDKDFARRFVDSLKKRGVTVWWADADISGGQMWKKRIEDAIERADIFIILLSDKLISSNVGMFELGAALGRSWQEQDVKLIPVMIKDVNAKQLPGSLQNYQLFDAKHLTPEKLADELGPYLSTHT